MDGLLSRINLEASNEAKGCAAMAAAGVASHLLYFIRGDHNRYAHRWITRALSGIAALAIAVLYLVQHDVLRAATLTALLAPSYFAGLHASIAVYRLFFHPLRRFPGPFWARLSNLYHLYMIRRSDNYLVMQRLHARYGPIVRTGRCRAEPESPRPDC
jgi:tryprostatin B 6-hydroxylase